MPEIAICSALYEAGRPFLRAYRAGLRAAVYGEDAILVVAIDDLEDPQRVIDGLSTICSVMAVKAREGASPAEVRRTLVNAGRDSGAEILIFADMDDMLEPDVPGLYRAALSDCDFAYGDLEVMNEVGEPSGRRFFDGANVPWRVDDIEAIAGRNFVGFSNSAVRASRIPEAALHIPADVTAADWWFFTTMVLAGRTGRRVPGAVTHYRHYPDSSLGAVAPGSPSDLRRIADIACRHYRAYPGNVALSSRRYALEELRATLQTMPDWQLGPAVAGLQGQPGVWFEHLWHIAGNAEVSPAQADDGDVVPIRA